LRAIRRRALAVVKYIEQDGVTLQVGGEPTKNAPRPKWRGKARGQHFTTSPP
jgi:hypothetical protein